MSVTKAKQTAAALLRESWLVGIGAAAVTGEGIAAAVRALKQKGEEFENRAPRLKAAGEAPGKAARKLGEKLGAGAARVRRTAESGVRSVVKKAGIPVREEIGALRRKVDGLTARLAEVQARKAVPEGQA